MKPVIFLLIACAFSLALIVPSIRYNIDDPNMITYMNLDEGELMDLGWFYYSGDKRPSFIWEEDYGLEMPYLIDACRALSPVIKFTPGSLVLFIRCIHLAGWVLALIALWRMTGRHFGKGWQQVAAVFLLAVRPAFAYFPNNLKPEPLVLFFMILGLDYTLRILDGRARRNIFLAVLMASVAFLIKYAGIFILPAAIAAMYISERGKEDVSGNTKWNRLGWSLPALLGTATIAFAFCIIFFYKRQVTGNTWFDDFGLLRSLIENKYALMAVVSGCLLISFSAVLYVFRSKVGGISSCAMYVTVMFAGITALMGFKWILEPRLFLFSHYWVGPVFFNKSFEMVSRHGFLPSFITNLKEKIFSFDLIAVLLFAAYLFIEFSVRRSWQEAGRIRFLKRMVLLVFIAPFAVMVLSMGNVVRPHMLPFFVAISLLAIQGIDIVMSDSSIGRSLRRAAVACAFTLLAADISMNAVWLVKERCYHFRQRYDVAYEIRDWMKVNIGKSTSIASDHYIRSYIPEEYVNVDTFYTGYFDKDPRAELEKIVQKRRPELVYYNEGPRGGNPLPPIKELLPGLETVPVKTFESEGRRYQRYAGDRFVIYKVIYQQGPNK